MSLKLYHFPNSRSLRILWTLKELNIECDVETRPLAGSDLKSEEYLALNPLGKVPVFYDGDKRLVESTAIIQYLADTYGDGQLSRRPQDADYGEFVQWLHFGEAGMGGYVNQLIGHTALLPEKHRIPAMRIWAEHETKNCLDFLESGLHGREYLLGDFSIADISIGYILFLIKVTGNKALLSKDVAAYFDRLRERPAWIAASAVEA